MNGVAQLQNNAELVKIKKSETLSLDATNPAGFTMAKGVGSLPLDRWNSERSAYQTVYSYNNTGYGSYGSPGLGSYGFQDLAYYGGFMNLPGYGMVWQPYGASSWMGWNPYIAGAWAFTPGFGYAWASAYPWGWLPYHYGAWGFSPGIGWFWAPGNSMGNGGIVTGWKPTAPVVKGPPGYVAPAPPATATSGPAPSILVGRIGRTPAYIPGGPTPPDFRSVIGHSGFAGMTAPATAGSGGKASAAVAHNSRADNMRSSNAASASGSTFAAPATASSKLSFNQANAGGSGNRSGHVFTVPAAPTGASQGYVAPWTPGYGGSQPAGSGSWAPVHGSGGASRANSTGGAAHSTAGAKSK